MSKKVMKVLGVIALVLLIVGGLDWGLIGLFGFNFVAFLPAGLDAVVYVLVGVSAVFLAVAKLLKKVK